MVVIWGLNKSHSTPITKLMLPYPGTVGIEWNFAKYVAIP